MRRTEARGPCGTLLLGALFLACVPGALPIAGAVLLYAALRAGCRPRARLPGGRGRQGAPPGG